MSSAQTAIDREKAAIQEQLDSIAKAIEVTSEEVAKAESEDQAAWAAFTLTNGKGAEKAMQRADATNRKAHSLVMRLQNMYTTQSALRTKLEGLDDPAELERRLATSKRLKEMRQVAESTKQTAKDQGVPDIYLAENGKFRTGMDARYKSDLVNSALGIENQAALMTFDPKDAEKKLSDRGWTHFLDRARESRTEKEAKKAAAAEKRAQEKAERDAEKAAEKAAKAEAAAAEKVVHTESKASDEVRADPKPVSTRKKK